MNLKKKNGFTLVEMLIVIVIIGILATALIPKLQSARGKANDVARKANLNQVSTALMSFNIDKGSFPLTGGALSNIEAALIDAGMSSIPKDPDLNRQFLGINSGATILPCGTPGLSPKGEFMYVSAKKGSIAGASYIVMAGTETEGGSNFMYSGNVPDSTLCSATEITDITRCDGECVKLGDNLRYLVTY